jgi:hypothetical protein
MPPMPSSDEELKIWIFQTVLHVDKMMLDRIWEEKEYCWDPECYKGRAY